MKKLFAVLLVVAMLASMATVVSAAETTTLTTTVPAATYTLNIPADQTVDFGATSTDIGFATVSNSSGFAEGKNLKVTVTYTPFTNNDLVTTIPYTLTIKDSTSNRDSKNLTSGDAVIFKGKENGTVGEKVYLGEYLVTGNPTYTKYLYADTCLLKVDSEVWGKALGGVYTSTITFTCEVVVEE